MLHLLYKMDKFLNSFPKQLQFNPILLQLQMLYYFLKTDCQEGN